LRAGAPFITVTADPPPEIAMAVCKTEKPLPRALPPSAVLFDRGNTLAAYYRPDEFGPILERAVDAALAELAERRVATVEREAALTAALAENREAADFRVTPMSERLARIFAVPPAEVPLLDTLCDRFLAPIFAVARLYDDAIPLLDELRAAGLRTAIVSNTPWGSPSPPWRRELARLGLAARVDAVVLCGDVGWRKPARQIFEHAASELGVDRRQCVFVGDELQWDVEGSRAAGMRPVLIDRDDRHRGFRGERIRDLRGLLRFAATA
jgi:putative hydrolase of the HAD superfamily